MYESLEKYLYTFVFIPMRLLQITMMIPRNLNLLFFYVIIRRGVMFSRMEVGSRKELLDPLWLVKCTLSLKRLIPLLISGMS